MTGGQTAMTLEESAAKLSGKDGSSEAAGARQGGRRTELNLVVVKATDDELAAHDALVEKIRESV